MLGYLQTCIKLITNDYVQFKQRITEEHTGINLLSDALLRIISQGLISSHKPWQLFQSLEPHLNWLAPQIRWINQNLDKDDKKITAFLYYALNQRFLSQIIDVLFGDFFEIL